MPFCAMSAYEYNFNKFFDRTEKIIEIVFGDKNIFI